VARSGRFQGDYREFSGPILNEKAFRLRLAGNEVYKMNSLIFLVKIMLCSKLHCQDVFKLTLLSYKDSDSLARGVAPDDRETRASSRFTNVTKCREADHYPVGHQHGHHVGGCLAHKKKHVPRTLQ